MLEDEFCPLSEKSGETFLLHDMDIGSLDSPVLSWLKAYDIPRNLIKKLNFSEVESSVSLSLPSLPIHVPFIHYAT